MITIVPYEPVYSEQAASLERQCFNNPWSRESLLRTLSGPGARALLALEGDRPVGFAAILALPPEGEIVKLAVLPGMREQGIGRMLAEGLIKAASEAGVNILHLEVRESNRSARILYEKCGFRYSGRRPGYYSNPREDAVLMKLRLG